jgi:hypothetical protein
MNDTLKTIVGLLETGKPELQVAAAQVLGVLRPKDLATVKALGTGLRRSPVLGRFCLDALAKIQLPEAIRSIASVTGEHDPLAEHASHLLGELGEVAQPILAEIYPEALGEQRARILAVLVKAPGRDTVPVFVRALLTPETTEVASRLLLGAAATVAPAIGKALVGAVQKQLENPLPESCLAHLLTVMARLDRDGARPTLLRFTVGEVGAEVRSAAFRALQGVELTAAQIRSLLEILEAPEQKPVHDAVRDLLAGLPAVPEAMLPVAKRLLLARDPEQRLFALRMLRTTGGVELAKFAIKWLDHDDVRFRDAAADSLASNRQAIEPLLRLILSGKDAAEAAVAARILARQSAHFSQKLVRELGDRIVKALAANPRVADLLLDVLLAGADAKLVASLLERCIKLRRSRRYVDAMHVLARLASTPYGGDEAQYQLALTRLLHDATQPMADSVAPGNPTMGFFANLVRGDFPVFDRLRKENAITPDILLRLATHFAAGVGAERRFGTELLEHLATRTKGRAGDEARVVLRSATATG